MKRFPRLLQLLPLLLVAIIWPGGSEVGVAMYNGAVSHKRLPPVSPVLNLGG